MTFSVEQVAGEPEPTDSESADSAGGEVDAPIDAIVISSGMASTSVVLPEESDHAASEMEATMSMPGIIACILSATAAPGSPTSIASYEDVPRTIKSLSDIYARSEQIELDDEQLMAATEEPVFYREAVGEPQWEEAMRSKLDAIHKNHT